MAKAAIWTSTDAEARKRGEQTGLDTLVVHALNDATYRDWETDRKSTRLNSSHSGEARMPSSA